MQENLNFKLSFLEKQNQHLKNDINLIRTKTYQLCKSKNSQEREQLILEILTILDLPVED